VLLKDIGNPLTIAVVGVFGFCFWFCVFFLFLSFFFPVGWKMVAGDAKGLWRYLLLNPTVRGKIIAASRGF
jgi:hypothetical protein